MDSGMMSSARPTAWHEGVASSGAAVLCGVHTHYAVSRAVGVMALGVRQIVTVASDGHRMDARALPPALARARDAAVLDTAFSQHAPSLFHQLDDWPSNDLGPRSFQCSRRGDALKVWTAILRYGRAGIAGFYDCLCVLTVAFHRMVDAHPSFEALHSP